MSPFKSHAWYAKCHTDHSQVQVAPVDEVNEAPRCPNRHVDPATQLPDLLPNVHTFTHMRTVRRQELPQSKHMISQPPRYHATSLLLWPQANRQAQQSQALTGPSRLRALGNSKWNSAGIQEACCRTSIVAAYSEAGGGVLELALHLLCQLARGRQDDAARRPAALCRRLRILLHTQPRVLVLLECLSSCLVLQRLLLALLFKLRCQLQKSRATLRMPSQQIAERKKERFNCLISWEAYDALHWRQQQVPEVSHLEQVLDDRQRKGERLARTRSGAPDEVAPLLRRLKHMLLDGKQRPDVALLQGRNGLITEPTIYQLQP